MRLVSGLAPITCRLVSTAAGRGCRSSLGWGYGRSRRRRRGFLGRCVAGQDGVGGSREGSNLQNVGRAERVLDEARVELDNLLDGVEVGDGDVERILDNQEGNALGAGRGSERAGVLQDLRALQLSLDVGEVDTAGNRGLGAGGGNLGERGRQRCDDGRGLAGRDLEHEGDDGELGGVGNGLVHHVELERVVLVTDVVLRGRVHVELYEAVVCACEAGGAINHDLDGGAEVEEIHRVNIRDIEDWARGCGFDGAI